MKRILFLGNSFTYFNNLPTVFSQLCKEMGKDVFVASVTKGGASLREFLNPDNRIGAQLEDALKEPWDIVVLQEQSFRPVGNPQSFLSAALELRQKIPSADFLFYQTWAYRDGSQKLKEKELSYIEMQEKLKNAYHQAAVRCDGTVVSVGDLFRRAWEDNAPVDLYCEDDFHPSPSGTYLAACAFVACVFDLDPLLFSDAPGIPSETATCLRQIASEGKLFN